MYLGTSLYFVCAEYLDKLIRNKKKPSSGKNHYIDFIFWIENLEVITLALSTKKKLINYKTIPKNLKKWNSLKLTKTLTSLYTNIPQ